MSTRSDELAPRTLEVDGRRARAVIGGRGVPVVFLHGWSLGPRSYQDALDELVARGCRVYAPGLPGFGGTANLPAADRTIEGYAAWVAAFLDQVGLGRAGGRRRPLLRGRRGHPPGPRPARAGRAPGADQLGGHPHRVGRSGPGLGPLRPAHLGLRTAHRPGAVLVPQRLSHPRRHPRGRGPQRRRQPAGHGRDRAAGPPGRPHRRAGAAAGAGAPHPGAVERRRRRVAAGLVRRPVRGHRDRGPGAAGWPLVAAGQSPRPDRGARQPGSGAGGRARVLRRPHHCGRTAGPAHRDQHPGSHREPAAPGRLAAVDDERTPLGAGRGSGPVPSPAWPRARCGPWPVPWRTWPRIG